MKTLILTIALTISAFIMNAQAELSVVSSGTTITVTVPVQTDQGNIIVGLYDEATFMKSAPIQGLESSIVDGKATVTFTDILPGTYGITLFHDKNDNKIMDFEANGMPKESYGVSNNVMNFGPPQWNDAKFEVTEQPIALDIRM